MKVPEILFYHFPNTDIYRMLNIKKKSIEGFMYASPRQDKFLKIDYLIIVGKKRQGLGTKFLNFAKTLSKQLGCKGKIHLLASTTSFDPFHAPHVFYRKNGFTTNDKDVLKKIDKSIKTGKELNYRKTPPVVMYYPDDNSQKSPTSLWDKFKEFVGL